MTDFSIEHFEGVIDEIERKLGEIGKMIDSVPGIVADAVDNWWVTEGMAAAIRWTANKTVEFGKWLVETVIDLLKGVAAPVYMAVCAWDWLEVRGDATQLAANVDPAVLKSSSEWKGDAQWAYRNAATAHNSAAKRVGDIGKDTATSLGVAAVGGLVFYGAILGIVVKAGIAMTGSLAAIASAIFSWAGAGLIVLEAAGDSAAVVAAITAVTALLGTQATALLGIKATATDLTVFPDGKWPGANIGTFNNATRLDGVPEWSIRTG
ncbi:hypothetical protein ACTWPB_08125 [Nocardia sp. IBHARD005]|uniref:hypothetical protein n=1 Tax=Nocardia sp. IBHARD005 TaxID=3457765 RepID=UPI0040582AB9